MIGFEIFGHLVGRLCLTIFYFPVKLLILIKEIFEAFFLGFTEGSTLNKYSPALIIMWIYVLMAILSVSVVFYLGFMEHKQSIEFRSNLEQRVQDR